jgi:hypothetical protein
MKYTHTKPKTNNPRDYRGANFTLPFPFTVEESKTEGLTTTMRVKPGRNVRIIEKGNS